MTQIQVTKRDGTKEDLDLEKMHKVVFCACENITGVSASEVEIKSHLSFYTGITSTEIQETMIKSGPIQGLANTAHLRCRPTHVRVNVAHTTSGHIMPQPLA